MTTEGLERTLSSEEEEIFWNAMLLDVEGMTADDVAARLPYFTVLDARPPGGLAAWTALRWLPWAAAVGFATLVIASVAHAVALSVSVRRHDLNVLSALGAVRARCVRRSGRRSECSWRSRSSLESRSVCWWVGRRGTPTQASSVSIAAPRSFRSRSSSRWSPWWPSAS